MRIPYEKQVILHELGMPIDKHFSVVMYPTAFEWFEDNGIYLDQAWDWPYDKPRARWSLSWDTASSFGETDTYGHHFEHNDRTVRYPAILDKMIEVYKEHFQK